MLGQCLTLLILAIQILESDLEGIVTKAETLAGSCFGRNFI